MAGSVVRRQQADMVLPDILGRAEQGAELTSRELNILLNLNTEQQRQALFAAAYRVKARAVGKTVYLRGLIECSNICRKDCFYCGIRKSNQKPHRYQMAEDEMVQEGLWCWQQGYGSVVIQGGERSDRRFINLITGVVRTLKQQTAGQLGITLSLGEQTRDVYKQWRKAGAHRYLLRIETTNPALYNRLHPCNHSYQQRLQCLNWLRELDYQVGTGVMIGLPGQSSDDLVNDLRFMKSFDIDMVGMGPYIPHPDTPLGKCVASYNPQQAQRALMAGLKMIAVTRLLLPDINIAAATSLEALHPEGRELGLKAGANIIMPNVTAPELRPDYTLYANKPGLSLDAQAGGRELGNRIAGIEEAIGYCQWGDSRRYLARIKKR